MRTGVTVPHKENNRKKTTIDAVYFMRTHVMRGDSDSKKREFGTFSPLGRV